jgi:hypothetical protein
MWGSWRMCAAGWDTRDRKAKPRIRQEVTPGPRSAEQGGNSTALERVSLLLFTELEPSGFFLQNGHRAQCFDVNPSKRRRSS